MDDARSLDVTILMPCLNEAETLPGCIAEAMDAIATATCSGEVLIADNGSTDGSMALATQAGARVVAVSDRGYGNALRSGIAVARGRFVLMGDADGSYDFRELPRFLDALRTGADLVMGCRLPRGGGTIMPGAMPWKHRWLGNPVLSALGRLFFRAPVDDFHCGLRAFRRQAVLDLNLACPGMEFASEMVVKAVVAGLRMTQVPITLRPDGRTRAPHLRSWRDGWRHLRFLLVFSPRWLFYVPGLVLSLVGLAGFALLLPGPVDVAGITFDTNTLLVCTMMLLVGFQAIFFAIHAKAYATSVGLLTPDPRIEQLFRAPYLELATLAGAVLVLMGLGYLGLATLVWQKSNFGPLSYGESLRQVIPGVTAMALGAQLLFSGFALAVIGIMRRPPAAAGPE